MTGIVIIPSGSETILQAAVASAGPVAAAVDARTNGFRVSVQVVIKARVGYYCHHYYV